MTTPNQDPWLSIALPSDAAHLSLRRVDMKGRWDFYWGKDKDANCALVLRADILGIPRSRLPHLKGIDLRLQPSEGEGKASLVLRLLDSAQREMFQRLCTDIVSVSDSADNENEAVARVVGRTWRWHHLLRGGHDILTPEEQIGLIGELSLLEDVFIPKCGPLRAVDSWRGPLGEAQDFVYGALRVEAKARGPSRAGDVRISSEHQLQTPEGGSLYLSVGVFEAADGQGEKGESVTGVAIRVRSMIAFLDPAALPKFDALLVAAGLDLQQDYSAWTWRQRERTVFMVREGFPRITPGDLPTGVTGVRYGLSLPGCSEFLVSPTELTKALEDGSDV